MRGQSEKGEAKRTKKKRKRTNYKSNKNYDDDDCHLLTSPCMSGCSSTVCRYCRPDETSLSIL